MTVSLEDFKKIQLKVAVIESVEPHPNADRLYILKIKTGDIQKQIVAGIRKHYTEEELKGKKIVIVDNLEPAVIRGVESNGMLLAASDNDMLTVIAPERPIADGALIK
jgi:tRNA-binding protein